MRPLVLALLLATSLPAAAQTNGCTPLMRDPAGDATVAPAPSSDPASVGALDVTSVDAASNRSTLTLVVRTSGDMRAPVSHAVQVGFEAGQGALWNVTVTFGPDGAYLQRVEGTSVPARRATATLAADGRAVTVRLPLSAFAALGGVVRPGTRLVDPTAKTSLTVQGTVFAPVSNDEAVSDRSYRLGAPSCIRA